MKKIKIAICVPKSLSTHLLEVNHLRFLTLLSSKTQMYNKYNEDCSRGAKFHSIKSKTIRELVKGDYMKKVIYPLINMQIIEVNNTYSTGLEESDAFPKSYRYNFQYWSDIENDRWNEDQVIPVTRDKVVIKKVVWHNEDPILEQILRFYDHVTVDDMWLDEEDWVCQDGISCKRGTNYFKDLSYIKQINSGKITTLSRPTYGRVFHPAICMSSKLRKHLLYDCERSLTCIDVKSCMPTLINYFVDDNSWWEHCQTDIYNSLNPNPLKYTRDEMKVLFQKAISFHKDNKVGKDTKLCQTAILERFPNVYNFLSQLWSKCSNDQDAQTPQNIFQSLESSIFVSGIMSKGVEVLPMHDGLIFQRKNSKIVYELLDEVIKDVLKAPILTYTIKDL